MAGQSQSEFQQAARLRWPRFHIHGDGPYALECPVTSTVVLYKFWMLAMTDIARDHSNWTCKAGHKLLELTPAPRRKRITHGPDAERD